MTTMPSRLRQALACLLAAVGATCVQAEHDHSMHGADSDLLLFPAVTAFSRSAKGAGLDRNDLHPELDLFYSTARERVNFLAEFLARDDEQEVERLQLGWLASREATVWLGRFHTPLGLWNTDHHHGAFLQTTLSRPSITAFEDDGGILPTHVTGLMAEGLLERAGGAWDYAVGLGRGPGFGDEGLGPLEIGRPSGPGRLAATARLGYQPASETAAVEWGGFGGWVRIPVEGVAGLERIDQATAGLFYRREAGPYRVIGELFRVRSRLEGAAQSRHGSFTSAYLQAAYEGSHDWTVYGRLEATSDRREDPYLALFPETVLNRAVAGLRYLLGGRQALKLELSGNQRQDGLRYEELGLQWSMIYP